MDTHTQADWAEKFRQFAELECPQDPLYVAICQAMAASPDLLALMSHVPATQARPNLLLAALHERILAGTPHALADYYPSVGGERLPDEQLAQTLHAFARSESATLVSHLRSRSTQTNEIGRCAVLWPALQHIANLRNKQELALFDLGCSAGLNLGLDDYHYRYLQDDGNSFCLGAAPQPERPSIDCRWLGEALAPPASDWRITQRLGADPQPIDVNQPQACRWLAACLWPHDRVRAERLQQALALARRAAYPICCAADCLDTLAHWLSTLPATVQPVLFNSWVLAYFEPKALDQFRHRIARLQREQSLVWLSAEAPELRPAGIALPALTAGASASTLWTLQYAEQDATRQVALAWSHPHGSWLQWLG